MGDKVKERRNEISMSQSELGALVGVSFHQISKYESGINRIPCSRLYSIANALNLPCQHFFNFDDQAISTDLNLLHDAVCNHETITKDILLSINLFKHDQDLFLKESIVALTKKILLSLEKSGKK
jgi:transcriptional regulator with XRE-family HTH domain